MVRSTPRPRLVAALEAAVSLVVGMAAAGILSPALGAERRPVPAVTIYPGDVIREDQLTDADLPDAVASSAYASNRSMLVGKVAKRTLLPGRAVPSNAVGEPRLVTVGARVRLVYEEDGLTITAFAAALQAGGAGDFISVRNVESGITVSGIIHADGSVHVGPG